VTEKPDAIAPKKAKKPDFKIEGCFSVRVKQAKAKKAFMHCIRYDAMHAKNMVLILRAQLYETQKTNERTREVYLAFINDRLLRDAVYGRKGGKSADMVTLIREFFKGNRLFEQLCRFCQRQLDAKTFHAILGSVSASYEQFFTNIAAYSANPKAYAMRFGNAGIPRPPKAKKLVTVSQASITLDREKWSLQDKVVDKHTKETRPYVRIKCAHKKAIFVPVNWHKFPVPEGKTLRSLNVNISNDAVYLNFTYGHEVTTSKDERPTQEYHQRQQKWAAADVGMINVLSLLVDDKDTPSLLMCGKRFKDYNKQFNRHKARLDKEIAAQATKFKTLKRKEGDVTIAIKHSKLGESIKRTRTHLIECRNRYFDTEFNKLSRRITDYLRQSGVTDLVLSKNLSFLKTSKEKSKLNSQTRQSFYHLPFGRLLNLIEQKCQLVGITLHFINEAYSSKVSCFSADVRQASAQRLEKGQSLSTNDCKGSRVKRGLYKDSGSGLKFHADINGAINHIKIANKDYNPCYLLHHKKKLCNPIRIKSDFSFCRLTPATRESKQYHCSEIAA
jgi:putative transposase